MSRMPRIYRPPWGGPLRWQDDVTGVLPTAVRDYIHHQADRRHPVFPQQVELVRDYCEYYINAPCWRIDGAEESFAKLRQQIKILKTADEISKWIWECLKHGIDPL